MVKVIEITTASCGICKSIAPMIDKAVQLQGNSIIFEKKEVTWEDSIVDEYNIRSVPTFLFFNSETNELIDRHSGPISMPQFNSKIKEAKEKI